MFNLLEKIRQKPESAKKRIAFLTAFFISGIIFVVWLSIIYPDARQGQIRNETVSKLEPSPVGTFVDTFKTGLGAIGEQIGKMKDLMGSLPAKLSSTTEATNSNSNSTQTSQ